MLVEARTTLITAKALEKTISIGGYVIQSRIKGKTSYQVWESKDFDKQNIRGGSIRACTHPKKAD